MKKFIIIILVFTICNSVLAQNSMKLSDKKVVKHATLQLPVDSVWKLWTTHDGLKTFFGLDNKMELAINGDFEIYFALDAPAGKKGSEGSKVLSFLPYKMLSFSWNAPPEFEELRNSSHKTWVVIDFNAVSNSATEITLSHIGWPADEKWNPVYDYFNKGWDFVLNSLKKSTPAIDNSPQLKKVTSIGGVFFKCKDPEQLKLWYNKNLGLNTDEYGTNFEWYQGADPSRKGFTQWSPFKEKTNYFDPSKKEFMINYRVDNLEKLVIELKKEGVTFTDSVETYDYGKFVHIMDPEGNKIELWEPMDTMYDGMVKGRTK
jgi:uncharacterized protein YndB with AHSA1/START domain/predicted enzyme related to lactoylglutathione lyase